MITLTRGFFLSRYVLPLAEPPGLIQPFATERKLLRTLNHPLRRGEIL